MTVLDGVLFIMGGNDSPDSTKVAMLDLVAGTWAPYFESLNTARASPGCASVEDAGTVWIAGGDTNVGALYTATVEYRFVHRKYGNEFVCTQYNFQRPLGRLDSNLRNHC